LQKLALLITPEDKSNKQENQVTLSFHWQPSQNVSTHLISTVNRFKLIKTTFQSSCD